MAITKSDQTKLVGLLRRIRSCGNNLEGMLADLPEGAKWHLDDIRDDCVEALRILRLLPCSGCREMFDHTDIDEEGLCKGCK